MTSKRQDNSRRGRCAEIWGAAILAGAGLADCVLASEAFGGALSVRTAILMHLAVIVAAGLALARVPLPDITPHAMALCLAVFAGPLGLTAGLLLTGAARRGQSRQRIIRRWRDWAEQDSGFDAAAQLAEP